MFACFHCSEHRRGGLSLSSSCFAYESHKRMYNVDAESLRVWTTAACTASTRVSAFLQLSPHPRWAPRRRRCRGHALTPTPAGLSPPYPARSSNLVASACWIPTNVPWLQQPSRTVSRETCQRGEVGRGKERCQLLICSGRRHKHPNNSAYRSICLRKTCNLALPPL